MLEGEAKVMVNDGKVEVREQIEDLVLAMIHQLAKSSDEGISLDFGSVELELDFELSNPWAGHLMLLPGARGPSNRRFARFCGVLALVYSAILGKIQLTKRDIYYLLPDLCDGQRDSDATIDDLCTVFSCRRLDLHIIASPRGIAQGDVEFLQDGKIVSCRSELSIKESHAHISDVKGVFKFVLVVEKETIFRKICADSAFRSEKPCLLVTGKGYPCLATRHFLKNFLAEAKVPCFILVDADVYGLEIYCDYKYGTVKRSVEDVALPAIVPIGLSISEARICGQEIIMESRDKSRLQSLSYRPYAASDMYLKQQIAELERRGTKAEVECLWKLSPDYLTKVYLPQKLQSFGL
eukprot:gb/GEZN01005532.1/.p1 GENE.gb/GEZN01005532.1/~~gb/GEZN01005532.1/.p1  ORF type:complete len:352 (-),score=44.59 gb/GEZN01005532.1/:588-1643(-)